MLNLIQRNKVLEQKEKRRSLKRNLKNRMTRVLNQLFYLGLFKKREPTQKHIGELFYKSYNSITKKIARYLVQNK